MFTKENDFNINYDIVHKNKIPILINDKVFNSIFSEIKNKDFITQKEELEDLLNEQKSIDKEIKILIKEKRKTMTNIINLSHKVNNGDDTFLSELNKCKEDIYKINDKIDELTFRIETLPSLIRESNFNLLKITVKYAYEIISSSGENISKLNKEIDELREKLRNDIEEKSKNEDRKNTTYGFLHAILGHSEMEKLDNKLL